LEGAAAMREAIPNSGMATAVVTLPPSPSSIGGALPQTGMSYASLVSTAEALERVADFAINRLTIMTPFLNRDGLTFVVSLFKRTRAPAKRLVVRRAGGALSTAIAQSSLIEEAGVSVFDYTIPMPGGFETFHAKIVLADNDLAYVGSANMTVFARHSMELGVLMDGRGAQVVANVVRAVERVASRVAVDTLPRHQVDR
jgi:phosphatidylserine/phosphatidylglycerophosphate/cardiolipin synthase-like enzyme